jgi:hypothetical protein
MRNDRDGSDEQLKQPLRPTNHARGPCRKAIWPITSESYPCPTVVSSESDAFVRSILGPTSSSERKRLLVEAAKAHIANTKNAGNGKGIDRHLKGLSGAI